MLLGSLLVLQGRWGLSAGDIAAFAAVLATTYKPTKALASTYTQLMDSLASADRLFSLLDSPEEPADVPDAKVVDGIHDTIRFRNVGFRYGAQPILTNIDLEIRAGEVIAVVGRTGGGKTTLVDLLLRFHDVSEGSIEIDGIDLREISRESFLDQIAVVSQEPFLFDATIGENIRYGRPDASDEEVRHAVLAAKVDDFVGQLPGGYDTEVGEFGMRLSGGQRQRITIARAILKNPALLVFDEATSALDAKTERMVQDAIDEMAGERTILLVAHRLSTIMRADRIIVLEEGRISQLGSHDELMTQPGIYRELMSPQASDESSAASDGLTESGAQP